jgi:hypothetical protein
MEASWAEVVATAAISSRVEMEIAFFLISSETFFAAISIRV